jgi:hypothetical protein
VVYTPVNEHFGIVPLEAMYARRPVIACNRFTNPKPENPDHWTPLLVLDSIAS